MNTDKILQYHAIFHPESGGGFTVVVPSLPGCITYGETLEEAKKMIADAIQGYLVSTTKHNGEIRSDESDFIGTINLSSDTLKTSLYA